MRYLHEIVHQPTHEQVSMYIIRKWGRVENAPEEHLYYAKELWRDRIESHLLDNSPTNEFIRAYLLALTQGLIL